jgi:hypothetical protein
MPVVLGVARAGRWTGSHEYGKGSECANLTGTSKVANVCGEMERQTKGLLTDFRDCVTQHIPPLGDEWTFLADGAPWFVATLQLFSTILLEPRPSLAKSAKKAAA